MDNIDENDSIVRNIWCMITIVMNNKMIMFLLAIISSHKVCCKSFLLYDSDHRMDIAVHDVDIYMQVSRDSTLSVARVLVLNNITEAKSKFPSNFVDNIIRDGFYEGLSLGFPASYSHGDPPSMVPYGCWHRKSKYSGIFINLGFNPVIADRPRLYKLLELNSDHDDRNFCSAAIKYGYTAIITNNPPYRDTLEIGSEVLICYGGCNTVRFNTTCPPGIDIRTGYQAMDPCECLDTHDHLNCNGKEINMEINDKPSGLAMMEEDNKTMKQNRCILENIDLITGDVHMNNHDLEIAIYVKIDMVENLEQNKQVVDHMISMIKMKERHDALILNIHHTLSSSTGGIVSDSLTTVKVNNNNNNNNNNKGNMTTAHDSVLLLYSTTVDHLSISTRKIITFNNTYIGVISTGKKTTHQWLLDDAICLKRLGAYFIILIGDFEYASAQSLMQQHLDQHIDVIITIDQHNNSPIMIKPKEYNSSSDDHRVIVDQEESQSHDTTYHHVLKIDIHKISTYKITVRSTIVRFTS